MESFWADPDVADFGPGAAYIEPIKHDTSDIVLASFCGQYPVVQFDENKPSLRFLDENDSLIGCGRPYAQYIWAGTIVYNKEDQKLMMYDRSFNPTREKARYFLDVSDSVALWAEKDWIQDNKTHIFSGDQSKNRHDPRGRRTIQEIIPINYPMLNYQQLGLLKQKRFESLSMQKELTAPQAKEQTEPKKQKVLPVLPCMALIKAEVEDTTVVEHVEPVKPVKKSKPQPKKDRDYFVPFIIGVILLGGLILMLRPRKRKKPSKDY